MIPDQREQLLFFKNEIGRELQNVLNFWQNHCLDKQHGGFIGRMNNFNYIDEEAPKSIILNTRILWTFSRAGNFYGDSRYDRECERAFDYLYRNFRDDRYGGVFWELDHYGKPTNKRKQVYAQAFCIYALAEYYKYSKNAKAVVWAQELFRLLEERAYDREYGGYIEAFNDRWGTIKDMRLSEKDLNAPKTTNTLLHVLEAYTSLLEVTFNPDVQKALERLLGLFHGRIFEHGNHLKLFFSKDWKRLSSEISYGHDIEAAWLVLHAARIVQDPRWIRQSEELHMKVCGTFLNEALDEQFGVVNSKDSVTSHVDTDRHWWPQAEAMVGLAYAWEISKDMGYMHICKQIWTFVKHHIVDHKNGEWFFRVNSNGTPYLKENKIGPWKCPYHNGRALIEVLQVIDRILTEPVT